MNINRRNFLGMTIGGVAASAAVRTWPFRVFSFPSEVKPVSFSEYFLNAFHLANGNPRNEVIFDRMLGVHFEFMPLFDLLPKESQPYFPVNQLERIASNWSKMPTLTPQFLEREQRLADAEARQRASAAASSALAEVE
jgi:hypothetical protein